MLVQARQPPEQPAPRTLDSSIAVRASRHLWTREGIGNITAFLLATIGLASAEVALQGIPGVPSPMLVLSLLGLFLALDSRIRSSGGRWAPVRAPVKAYGLVVLVTLAAAVPGLFLGDADLVLTGFESRIRTALIGLALVVLITRRRALRHALVGATAALVLMVPTALLFRLGGAEGTGFRGLASEHFEEIDGSSGGLRTAGPQGDPNYFAQFLLVAVILSLASTLLVRHWAYRIGVGFLVLLSLPVMLTSFSRGGLLGVVVAAWFMRPPELKLARAAAVAAAAVVVFVLAAPAGLVERSTQLLSLGSVDKVAYSDDSGLRGRTSELVAAVEMFKDHPMLGVGLNSYEAHYLEYSAAIGLDSRIVGRAAHTLPGETLAEQGMVGGVVWLVVVVWLLRRLQHVPPGNEQLARAWRAAFAGYLTTALFLHDARLTLLWILIGLGLAIATVAPDSHPPPLRSVAPRDSLRSA